MSEPISKEQRFEIAAVKDFDFGARECDLHFGGKGKVWGTARRFIEALREREIDSVLVGDLSMFLHGYRRVTSIVELIVNREGLAYIHQHLEELGVCKDFPAATSVRDSLTHVKIRLHFAGTPRPGNSHPHLIIPEPSDCSTLVEGLPVISLIPMIELRLAMGLAENNYERECIDVVELIRVLRLPRDFADRMHQLVQPKYISYWTELNVPPPKYIRPLRSPGCLESLDAPEALLQKCGFSAEQSTEMIHAGLVLERRASGKAMLTTIDYDLAEKYDMHLEDEHFRIDDY
ncbi:hypothetical protein [Anatilimnocola floriformis]|uniref:hypothetical protein n=1 Tax=Anatilimnocola floriformis TaxID=2948575 RepID=UPI0020C1C32F|nr:hypothetical protein [Anatilimnocola floriformis]